MHITELGIHFAPMFKRPLEFQFDAKVNLFVGPNGSGKSSLLRMLSMIPYEGHQFPGDTFQYLGQFWLVASPDWSQVDVDEYEIRTSWTDLPWVQICSTRINLPWSETSKFRSQLHGYGDCDSLSDIFRHGYDWDVFDANLVEKALPMLVDQAQAKPDGRLVSRLRRTGADTSAGHNLSKAMSISYHCAKSISSEILTGEAPHNLVTGESDFQSTLFIRYPEVRLGMALDTVDRNGVVANHLSSGTQDSLLWIRFLALQILYHYKFEDGWENQPAILLIDEIENHLHPTWQRRVIPALLEHFPGLQIFATTHSPFVVAGLEKGQVHMLQRNADGVITATPNEHDIIGWTTDEILRTFMGVDEPTDQLTIDRRERLLELRRRDSLTAEEEAEMGELRRHVNEDFLSSSTPLEAQRERYGDMMLEFLRSRQSELSQDGS